MTEARRVGDVMTPNPVWIADSASLAEAAGMLETNKISGLPVLDAGGSLVGVLSQTDLIRARANPTLLSTWTGLSVSQVMTRPAITIGTAATLSEAAAMMDQRRVHRLVVTDEASQPIGIISASDLVRSWLG